MAIRISGLSSGLDTESLVSELVSAYSVKKNNYVKAQTKLSWKQDAWKALNKKVYSLYSNISSLRYSSAYSLKKTSVSDSTKATVSASSNAINGTQSLKVKSLATAGYLTGGQLKTRDDSKAGGSTKLSNLTGNGQGLAGDEIGTISVNGREINLSGSDSVSNVVNKLKDAGVNASYDSTNNRIFVSSKDSGTANEFTLTASDENGAKALQSLGLMTNSNSATSAYNKILSKYGTKSEDTGAYTGVDKAKIRDDIINGDLGPGSFNNADYAQKLRKYQYAKTLSDSGSEAANKITDDYMAYRTADSNTKAAETAGFNLGIYNGLKDLSKTELENRYFDKDGNWVGVERDEEGKITSIGGISVDDTDAIEKAGYKISGDGKDLEGIYKKNPDGTFDKTEWTVYQTGTKKKEDQIDALTGVYGGDEDSAYAKLQDDINTMGEFTKNYDVETLKTLYDESGSPLTGMDAIRDDALTAVTDKYAEKVQAALDAINGTGVYANSEGAVRVNAEDAEIELNGATFKGASNTFNINGLTINAIAKTGDEAISITTNTDSQAIYDKVKDFLSQYNDLMNEMSRLYNAASAKGYEPLTTEEKAALTDTQVEEWEDKVKSALLRRDNTLDSLLGSMSSSMQNTYMMGYNANGTYITLNAQSDGRYKGNDGQLYTLKQKDNGVYTFLASDGKTEISAKNYSFATFGIRTLGILNAEANEQYAYHIDGDADDSSSNGNADKLMAAINKDPDSVIGFLKNASSSLYNAINKKMTSTSMRSAYTVYNDKQMGKEYSDYNTTIKKWEDKVAKIEDSYYKKFAAMEKALTTLQGNQSSLSGLFG
jgi:flagellar hook-associated protein 2